MKVLAIAGSLRRGSHNRRLVEAATSAIAARGVEAELLDPEALRSLPHFDEDLEAGSPESVERLRAAIEEADGLLIATPEYNGSIPSVIKNAVDWASRPRGDAALKNKPVAVIGASTMPFGAVWAQAELRKVLGAAGARVVEGELALGTAADAFLADAAGRRGERHLAGEEQHEALEAVIASLLGSVAERLKRVPEPEPALSATA